MIMAIVPLPFHEWCQKQELTEVDEIMLWRIIVMSNRTAGPAWHAMAEETRWMYALGRYTERKHEALSKDN